jgi:hypothetical protein
VPSRPPTPDPYELLGVSETAPDEVINAAWRVLIKQCHPDNATSPADAQARAARSVALNQARDTLLDPNLRAEVNEDRRARVRSEARAAGEGAGRSQGQATTPAPRQTVPDANAAPAKVLAGWLLHSRIGQWISVGIVIALMTLPMDLAGWPPILAAAVTALLAGAMISTYNGRIRGTPLGDVLAAAEFVYGHVAQLIRGLFRKMRR